MKNKIILLLIISFSVISTHAQKKELRKNQLTIEDCYEMAQENYPQIKLYNLIAQSESYSLSNASKAYLPQFNLTGKATYQTEVTKIPIALPGVQIPSLNKDQYQIVAEVNQLIWDGGIAQSNKQMIKAEHEVDKNQLEVEMFSIKERINDIYFGILFLSIQISLNDIHATELKTNLSKVESAIQNGTANQTDKDIVLAEIILNSQRKTEVLGSMKAYSDMLAYFVGLPETQQLQLVHPQIYTESNPSIYAGIPEENPVIFRPEMDYFSSNIHLLETQIKKIQANNLPKLSAFIQGGYGNPGLNMLEEGFQPYAIGGVKLSWNFGGLYTRKNDLKKINNKISKVQIQQDVFIFNSTMQMIRQINEIKKYEDLLLEDDKIIQLRESIKKASEAKVENGTMNTSDLVRDMNSVLIARQNKALHELEKLKYIYQHKHTLNK